MNKGLDFSFSPEFSIVKYDHSTISCLSRIMSGNLFCANLKKSTNMGYESETRQMGYLETLRDLVAC